MHLTFDIIYELTDLNITRYTRETESEKLILCISLNLVESKLNCQNRDYPPLGILLRVFMTIVWYHGEFANRIFYF